MSISVATSNTSSSSPSAPTPANDKLAAFGDFGKLNRKLWTGDYGLGFSAGLQKVLVDGVKLNSSIGYDLSANNTVSVKTNKQGKGKFGFNVASAADGARPSIFARWALPVSDATTIGMRIHKPHWKNDNCLPFFGWDWNYQNRNLAVTTSIGSNVSDRMDSNDRNNARNLEISHSVAAGNGPFSVGGEVKYARSGSSRYAAPSSSNSDDKQSSAASAAGNGDSTFGFTDFNLGADYNRSNYGLGVRTHKQFRHLTGTMWGDVDKYVRVGALQSYDIHSGTAKTGLALRLGDEQYRLKAKADTTGDVGGSVVARLYDNSETPNQPGGIKLHANLTYNVCEDRGKHAGFGFSIGDI
jgi:hypothetical protein